jgi:hypothetical protein
MDTTQTRRSRKALRAEYQRIREMRLTHCGRMDYWDDEDDASLPPHGVKRVKTQRVRRRPGRHETRVSMAEFNERRIVALTAYYDGWEMRYD